MHACVCVSVCVYVCVCVHACVHFFVLGRIAYTQCIDAAYCYRCHNLVLSIVCVSVCMLVTMVSCAKRTAELIVILYGV